MMYSIMIVLVVVYICGWALMFLPESILLSDSKKKWNLIVCRTSQLLLSLLLIAVCVLPDNFILRFI